MFDPAFLAGVKEREGFSATPKWDHKQWSWGNGTRWTPGMGASITPEAADKALIEELTKARGYVTQRFPGLDQSSVQGLSSFTYNLGPGWMKGTGLSNAIDAGDLATARKIMLEYNRASGQVQPGLIKRREWEASYLGAPTTDVADTTMKDPAMPTKPTITGAPPNLDAMKRIQALVSQGDQARSAGKYMDSIAQQSTPVGSGWEGASRVLAAVGGGLMENQARQADDARRAELVSLLGGQDSLSPVEQYALASGDKTLANTVVSRRLTPPQKDPIAQQRDALIAAGVDPAKAGLIAAGAIKQTSRGPVNLVTGEAPARAEPTGKWHTTGDGKHRMNDATGELVPLPESVAKPKADRIISDTGATKRGVVVAAAEESLRNANDFQDSYAGYGSTLVSGVVNTVADYTPFGTEEQKKAAAWWRQFQPQKNKERHELFGSALTKSEAPEFDKQTIDPAMQPGQIRKVLSRMQVLRERAVQKLAQADIAAGYKPEQIEAIYGRSIEELKQPVPEVKSWSEYWKSVGLSDETKPASSGDKAAPPQQASPASGAGEKPYTPGESLAPGDTRTTPDGKRWRFDGNGMVPL